MFTVKTIANYNLESLSNSNDENLKIVKKWEKVLTNFHNDNFSLARWDITIKGYSDNTLQIHVTVWAETVNGNMLPIIFTYDCNSKSFCHVEYDYTAYNQNMSGAIGINQFYGSDSPIARFYQMSQSNFKIDFESFLNLVKTAETLQYDYASILKQIKSNIQ